MNATVLAFPIRARVLITPLCRFDARLGTGEPVAVLFRHAGGRVMQGGHGHHNGHGDACNSDHERSDALR